jgi:hypothetical protein
MGSALAPRGASFRVRSLAQDATLRNCGQRVLIARLRIPWGDELALGDNGKRMLWDIGQVILSKAGAGMSE